MRTNRRVIRDNLSVGISCHQLPAEHAGLARQRTRRLKEESEERARIAAAQNAARLRARLDAQQTATGAPGERGDGVFRISFIQMGQGDCAIMATPKGKIILIDCGLNSHDDEDEAEYGTRVQAELNHGAYLRDTTTIDIVILTHPDKDHYNQLGNMLPTHRVATIYHTGDLSHYSQNGGSTWCRKQALDEHLIKKVMLSKEGDVRGSNSLAGKDILPATGTEWRERLEDGGLIVHHEPGCTVTLMAAGVDYDYVADKDSTDKTNRGSIVTLIDVFGQKILIMGDATRSTEHFLMLDPKRAARLKDVDILQAGHHGSNRTSSGQAWVDHTSPQGRVVVSAGEIGHRSHGLPSWVVVERYLHRFEDNGRNGDAERHLIMAWDKEKSRYAPLPYKIDQPVYSTGSSGTIHLAVHP